MQTTRSQELKEQLFEGWRVGCVAGYDHVPKVVQILSHRHLMRTGFHPRSPACHGWAFATPRPSELPY
jgi:hypothetical protein